MLVHVYIAPVLPATSVQITSVQFIAVARSIQSIYLLSHIARSSLDSRLTARHTQTIVMHDMSAYTALELIPIRIGKNYYLFSLHTIRSITSLDLFDFSS